jgi:hypothetical protein
MDSVDKHNVESTVVEPIGVLDLEETSRCVNVQSIGRDAVSSGDGVARHQQGGSIDEAARRVVQSEGSCRSCRDSVARPSLHGACSGGRAAKENRMRWAVDDVPSDF